MINLVFTIIGSISLIAWGTAHLFPTKAVIKGFGDISKDNKEILKMEWMTEGFSLIFTGLLVLLVSLFGDPASISSRIVNFTSSTFLTSLAVLSLFTGFKVNFLPYKLCPLIFSLSAILILMGSLL